MNVEDTGTGPAILALHGLGGGAYFFRGLAERLLPDYRVVAVDLPASADASMTGWVDALGTLVDERIGQPVVVLGHSMGTIIGLEAWARWPERMRAAIFVGGVPRVAPHIRERLSERVHALAGATDLDGWGKRVSPGVFAAEHVRGSTRSRVRVRAALRAAVGRGLRALLHDSPGGKR